MRLQTYRSTTSAGGNVYVEYAVVFPLLLLVMLAAIQLAMLAHARMRMEAALDSAARSYIVYGEPKRARQAAAQVMAPVAIPLPAAIKQLPDVPGRSALAMLTEQLATGPGMMGTVAKGTSRFIYAYAHTQIEICFDTSERDHSALIVDRGDPIRLDLTYDLPIVMPLVGTLFDDGYSASRSDSAAEALEHSLYATVADPSLGKLLDQRFNHYPKRRLHVETGILWMSARNKPQPEPICVG